MARRRHTPEQIIRKLREAGRLVAEGAEVADIVEKLGGHDEPVDPDQRGHVATVAFHQGSPVDAVVNSRINGEAPERRSIQVYRVDP